MNIVVLMRSVPDTVEELEIDGSGKALDTQWLRFITSESDEHALEEALILKERHGGSITVVAMDAPEIDDALFAAYAKGADKVIRISSESRNVLTSAQVFAHTLKDISYDIILTGVQAIDDMDGQIAPFLSSSLNIAYLGVVTGLTFDDAAGTFSVKKEYAGGLRGEFILSPPFVMGVQAAEKPPRYVPVAKIRAAMKNMAIEEASTDIQPSSNIEIRKMYKPVVLGRAEILEGSPQEVAERLASLIAEQGLLGVK